MTKIRSLALICIVFLLSLSVGCASIKPNPNNPIRTVAVLPVVNNTNDVNGPKVVRYDMAKKLSRTFYEVKSIKESDTLLQNQMGVTLGKQLANVTPQQLGELLKVDALMYGYLLNYDDKISGVYNVKKVRMGWKMVDSKTGAIHWGKGVAVKKEVTGGAIGAIVALGSRIKELAPDPVNKLPGSENPMQEMPGMDRWVLMKSENKGLLESAVEGVLDKGLSKAFGMHLQEERDYAFRHLFWMGGNPILIGPVEKPTPFEEKP